MGYLPDEVERPNSGKSRPAHQPSPLAPSLAAKLADRDEAISFGMQFETNNARRLAVRLPD
jgi:hypothetical protein